MFEEIKSLFLKPKLQQVVLGLRTQEETFNRRVAELAYDRKRGEREIEAVLRRGTDASLKGNDLAKKEAAVELKAARAETVGLDQEMATAIKARAFVRITRRKLERSSDSSLKASYNKVSRLLDDSRLKEMLLRADVSLDQFVKRVDVALSRALEGMVSEDSGGICQRVSTKLRRGIPRKGRADRFSSRGRPLD
ncbi:MAG: hypothetical protein NT154_25790 [Verrucomicrobia bacterium]|nr:hypothetical protein [Verrucomicrobiota bacterium]